MIKKTYLLSEKKITRIKRMNRNKCGNTRKKKKKNRRLNILLCIACRNNKSN